MNDTKPAMVRSHKADGSDPNVKLWHIWGLVLFMLALTVLASSL